MINKSWTNFEAGPICPCGKDTYVEVSTEGISLICIFHGLLEGAIWTLPEERPENWPNLSNEEIEKMIAECSRDI